MTCHNWWEENQLGTWTDGDWTDSIYSRRWEVTTKITYVLRLKLITTQIQMMSWVIKDFFPCSNTHYIFQVVCLGKQGVDFQELRVISSVNQRLGIAAAVTDEQISSSTLERRKSCSTTFPVLTARSQTDLCYLIWRRGLCRPLFSDRGTREERGNDWESGGSVIGLHCPPHLSLKTLGLAG